MMAQKAAGINVDAFIVSVLDQLDVANLVLESIIKYMDIKSFESYMTYLYKLLPQWSKDAASIWQNFARYTPDKLIDHAKNVLPQQLSTILDYWDTQLAEAQVNKKPMTAQAIALESRYYQLFQGHDLWVKALVGYPSDIAAEKIRRYWNKQTGYEYPSEKDLLLLWKLGLETREKVEDYYREIEALPAETAKNIVEMRKWQVGWPSLRDMNVLLQLQKIDKSDVINYMRYNYGFSTTMAENMLDLLDYTPSPSEILRLSDLIPLDMNWVEEQLKENGLAKTERDIYIKAIRKRPLRDEATRMSTVLIELYQYGAINDSEFKKCLSQLELTTEEINAKLILAKVLRQKYITLLKRDAKIYLYRKGVYDEETLREKLTYIGIDLAVANAIVELEAAKKGVELIEE